MAEKRIDPWMIATVILAVLLIVVLSYFTLLRGPVAASELTTDEAKSKTVEYINSNLVQPGTSVSVVSVDDSGDFYIVTTLYQGQEIPVYLTKDGTYLFLSGPLNITEPLETPTPSPTPTPSQIKTEDLRAFVSCLNNSSFKIYGTKSCVYCQQLVGMLGGYEMVAPIYIDCNEQSEECNKANIMAYPTIFVNGTLFTGQRTFEDFSLATGCPVPPGA